MTTEGASSFGSIAAVALGTNTQGYQNQNQQKKGQGESFHVWDVEASTNSRTFHNGKVCRPCLLKKRSWETELPVLITIQCANWDPKLCWVDAEKVEK